VSDDRWSEVVARIVAAAPERIDDLTAPFEPSTTGTPGGEVFPVVEGVLMPQTEMARSDAVAVGFRVEAPLPDLVDRALRLAAFALEHDCEIVVLSHVEESGFERFGFRVERIVGATDEERAACDEQIRRFWNIDLVL
jgi:hypothetical protein